MEEADIVVMTSYRVTTELKTPWWKSLLRFLRVLKQRDSFNITFDYNYFKKGEILETVGGVKVKIVSKAEYIGGCDPYGCSN